MKTSITPRQNYVRSSCHCVQGGAEIENSMPIVIVPQRLMGRISTTTTCRFFRLLVVFVTMTGFLAGNPIPAAVIGVDAIHGFDSDTILGNGNRFDDFRSTITGLGHTIVPLNSFTAANLAGLDGLILLNSYTQNGSTYAPAEMAAIWAFANRAVFVSDASLWGDAGEGSDRPITFGNNRLLLQNSVNYIASGGILFIGEDGSGFDISNYNALVAPFGIQYAGTPTDTAGRTVTGFVSHALTSGITSIGVDFQLPITSITPAVDLTVGIGQDNVLAVSVVPEPSMFTLCGLAAIVLGRLNLRRRR